MQRLRPAAEHSGRRPRRVAAELRRAWPDPWPGRFGHHEIWHVFVLAGAGAHYAFTYSLVDLPYAPF